MRESIAADLSVRAERAVAGRGPRLPGRARPAVQGRDRRRPPGRRRARRGAGASHDLLPAGSVHRPVPWAARREHGQDRPVQAARHGRGVLAGRREAPDAPARLRHGLGDPGAARPVPVAPGRGEEARSSPARRPARPVQLPRRLAGLRVLASEGPAHLADARVGHARAPAAARLPGGQHADRGQRTAVAAVRPLGPLPRQHVPDRVRGPDLQPQADELPGEHVHLPLAPALVSRPAAPLQRVRPAASQRAVGDAQRPDPGAPVHPGRRAPVRPARTS